MLSRDARLARARAAYDAYSWSAALSDLAVADQEADLDVDDLERMAFAAHLVGQNHVATATGIRVFGAASAAGELERAARAGFWTGLTFAYTGELAQAGAWLGRAAELVEKSGHDTVESGYLLVPVGFTQADTGDSQAALETYERVAAIAERFGDPDLATFGRLGRGSALIALGEREHGFRFLDEAMAGVIAGEASPPVAGIVYCETIELSQTLLDMRRAREWTAALGAWTDAQPDLIFQGRCQVFRAELMRFQGDWVEAADEVERARIRLSGPPRHPSLADAHYEEAELFRLRGRFEDAERDYGLASEYGRRAEPGLALLRLAQGRGSVARSMIDRALAEEPADPRMLDAARTIALAQDDAGAARGFVERLRGATASDAPPMLAAITSRAEGELLLAEGLPAEALRSLRRALSAWLELDAPYDAARCRVALALACRALGDHETAEHELATARRVFTELGALPAIAELDRVAGTTAGGPNGLSPREVEVLGHLAVGRTNREIATELGISERTVDRHVSNVYTKLDVSTRAAATAWAFEHGLA